MKRVYLALSCGLLAFLAAGQTVSPPGGQTEIPKSSLVGAVRTLNTYEFSYHRDNGRFANREEILAFLQQKGVLSETAIDLENPKPYELAITTTQNGKHYQITLKRPSDMNDTSTWCKTAVFSDDSGMIFLGAALNCESTLLPVTSSLLTETGLGASAELAPCLPSPTNLAIKSKFLCTAAKSSMP
jgi:hypothetical protein